VFNIPSTFGTMVSSLVVVEEAAVVAEKQEIENPVSVIIEDVDGGVNLEKEEEGGIEEEKVAAAEAAVKGSQEVLGAMVEATEVVAVVMAVRAVLEAAVAAVETVLRTALMVVLMGKMVAVQVQVVEAKADLSLLKEVEA